MALASTNGEVVTLPSPSPDQVYVTISALEGGHLTLPESLFVTPADPEKRSTVPSLSFLIQHPPSIQTLSQDARSETTKLIFDLGLKRDFSGYREAQQQHIAQRQPTTVSPDVAESLQKGGLSPEDINKVVLSHVHWDHVGTPSDFPNAEFVVGNGTLHLLAHGGGPLYPASLFNADELPRDRTKELPAVQNSAEFESHDRVSEHRWQPMAGFPSAIDFFADGSLYIIDAPGHLHGHVNLLARTAPGKWVYLGGDCCHDPRILSREREIALYDDGKGGLRSVHMDTDGATRTVERVPQYPPLLSTSTMQLSSLLGAIALLTLAAAEPTVYLIRHGEKPDSGNGLSAAGQQRAQCLRSVFGATSKYQIGHIMAQTPKSDGKRKRPYDTVAPLAADLGLSVDTSCDRDDAKCVEDVVKGYTGSGNILICWEHDALSDIVDELGKDDNPPSYPDDA
ncbi:uncharacterized protein N0V89_008650 [Didymosphaeria variabile]|uniref:Metallo-beta-lactamase domain-containing protein n=1 Tax=Didymosphaeria variabile TaxID=1932322 RepID=A0A9W9C8S2_9PLEO|nr:uncharacterized protein N0V89_008650 [Didymosphaeria variabile]KAJ4350029.1 hypothetical protein N0V89_008650 [Didymosphaeria variabile]